MKGAAMPQEIEAKRILNRSKHPSSWFGVQYGFNVYRGCEHRCIYCDSRSECYGIDDFDDITVKINAPELLRHELSRKRNRRVVIGTGAMSDPYTPIELKYRLTRACLQVIAERRFPVNICTKSNLILRDADLLEDMSRVYACVQFTITTADDSLAALTEPFAPPPSQRFDAMGILSELGVRVGITMMPLLPYINESEDDIRKLVKKAHHHGAAFIVPAFGMTLRDQQRAYYYDKLDAHFPGLREKYEKRFGNYYSADVSRYRKLKSVFMEECSKHRISTKMPSYQSEVSGTQLSFLDDT